MNPGWRIQFDYDPDLVEALKGQVPHTERKWNPEEKYWWVSDKYLNVLKQLFSNMEAFSAQGKLL